VLISAADMMASAARMYSSRVSSRVLRKQVTTFLSAEVVETLSMSANCTILHVLAALCVALLDASMHAQAGAAAGARPQMNTTPVRAQQPLQHSLQHKPN
jgi:hypothetical protein